MQTINISAPRRIPPFIIIIHPMDWCRNDGSNVNLFLFRVEIVWLAHCQKLQISEIVSDNIVWTAINGNYDVEWWC